MKKGRTGSWPHLRRGESKAEKFLAARTIMVFTGVGYAR
jgi:hypothetical protein